MAVEIRTRLVSEKYVPYRKQQLREQVQFRVVRRFGPQIYGWRAEVLTFVAVLGMVLSPALGLLGRL